MAVIAGARREWDASILEQVPDQRSPGPRRTHATDAGAVRFDPAGPSLAVVHLTLGSSRRAPIEPLGDTLGIVERPVILTWSGSRADRGPGYASAGLARCCTQRARRRRVRRGVDTAPQPRTATAARAGGLPPRRRDRGRCRGRRRPAAGVAAATSLGRLENVTSAQAAPPAPRPRSPAICQTVTPVRRSSRPPPRRAAGARRGRLGPRRRPNTTTRHRRTWP